MALLLYGVAIGVLISGYLVQNKQWEWFSFLILGWCLIIFAGFLMHARTRDEQAECKTKAVSRYNRMRTRFGDRTLKCIRYACVGMTVIGFVTILLTGLFPDVDQSIYPIALGVMAAGLLMILPFTNPSAGNIIWKKKES